MKIVKYVSVIFILSLVILVSDFNVYAQSNVSLPENKKVTKVIDIPLPVQAPEGETFMGFAIKSDDDFEPASLFIITDENYKGAEGFLTMPNGNLMIGNKTFFIKDLKLEKNSLYNYDMTKGDIKAKVISIRGKVFSHTDLNSNDKDISENKEMPAIPGKTIEDTNNKKDELKDQVIEAKIYEKLIANDKKVQILYGKVIIKNKEYKLYLNFLVPPTKEMIMKMQQNDGEKSNK